MRVRTKLQRILPLRVRRIAADETVDLAGLAPLRDGFVCTNPSFLRWGDGYLLCIRGVNYVEDETLKPRFLVGDHFMTENHFLLLDRSFRPVRHLPGIGAAFTGIEDIKLFNMNGTPMGVGSTPNRGEAAQDRAIGLLTLDIAADRGVCRELCSPLGLPQEKNWAPFVKNGRLHFIHSFHPLIVLACDQQSGTVQICHSNIASPKASDLQFLISGSSAGIRRREGFLFAAHRRKVSLPSRHRDYVSRLYYLSDNMRLSFSRYFLVGPTSTQFINGMDLDAPGTFMIAYGVHSQEAHLCRVSEVALLRGFVAA